MTGEWLLLLPILRLLILAFEQFIRTPSLVVVTVHRICCLVFIVFARDGLLAA